VAPSGIHPIIFERLSLVAELRSHRPDFEVTVTACGWLGVGVCVGCVTVCSGVGAGVGDGVGVAVGDRDGEGVGVAEGVDEGEALGLDGGVVATCGEDREINAYATAPTASATTTATAATGTRRGFLGLGGSGAAEAGEDATAATGCGSRGCSRSSSGRLLSAFDDHWITSPPGAGFPLSGGGT
jgi:hypothetical protein